MFAHPSVVKAGLFWLMVLTTASVTEGSSQQISDTAQEPAVNAWFNTPPYRRLGDPRTRSWGRVEDVPVPVYKEALHLLGDLPSTWYIRNLVNYAGTGQRIVLMISDKAAFCCFVSSSTWERLNTPSGIPYINDVMGSFHESSDVLHHTQQRTDYIEHVALLYKGLHSFVLTKNFLHDVEKEGIKDWLTSTEKRPQAFRTFFS